MDCNVRLLFLKGGGHTQDRAFFSCDKFLLVEVSEGGQRVS